jgi:CheY-like chemotaxis protein
MEGAGRDRDRHGARILIVDDDDVARGLHEAALSLHGYGTESAADGVEALAMLALDDYDLVITDCNMPRMNGLTLVRTLRGEGRRVPILMVSGSLAQGDVPLDVRNELSAALPKPVRLSDLLAGVASALGIRQPRRERLFPESPNTTTATRSACPDAPSRVSPTVE